MLAVCAIITEQGEFNFNHVTRQTRGALNLGLHYAYDVIPAGSNSVRHIAMPK